MTVINIITNLRTQEYPINISSMRKILSILVLTLTALLACKKEEPEATVPTALIGKWLDTQSTSTDSTHYTITRTYEEDGTYIFETDHLTTSGETYGRLRKGTYVYANDSIYHTLQTQDVRHLPYFDWQVDATFTPYSLNERLILADDDSLKVSGFYYNLDYEVSHTRISN